MRKVIGLLAFLFVQLASFCQVKSTIEIGDKMLPLKFNKIYNKPGEIFSFSKYKGTLVIIDFWNRYCSGCIAAFPKMDSLQEKIGDKVKIVLVTNDSKEELDKLFKRVKKPKLPIIYGDSLLWNMFPHMTVPHHVWITMDGKVKFITDGYTTNEKNILKILAGESLILPEKKEVGDFQNDAPLWQEGNGRLQKHVKGYSFAMGRIEENNSTMHFMRKDPQANTIELRFLNASLLDMYKFAFGNSIYYSMYKHNNRVVFNVADSGKRLRIPRDNDSLRVWADNNLVCYESKWVGVNDSLAFQYFQTDLNKFFDYSVSVENRLVDCYSLRLVENYAFNKISTDKKNIEYDAQKFVMRNMPVSVLAESFNGMPLFDKIPVIDETKYEGNIDVSLYGGLEDLARIKSQLLNNGLVLELKRLSIKMLVINDKN